MDGTLFSINMSLLRRYSGIWHAACGDRLPSPSSGMRLPASGLRQLQTTCRQSPPRSLLISHLPKLHAPCSMLSALSLRSSPFAPCPQPSLKLRLASMPSALRLRFVGQACSMLLKAGLYALRAVLTLRCLDATLS